MSAWLADGESGDVCGSIGGASALDAGATVCGHLSVVWYYVGACRAVECGVVAGDDWW